jgi:hypothetical protein
MTTHALPLVDGSQQFSASIAQYPPLFSSDSSVSALERTIALHFLRTGQFSVARTFLEVHNFSLELS